MSIAGQADGAIGLLATFVGEGVLYSLSDANILSPGHAGVFLLRLEHNSLFNFD